jgi:hypothetical protein
VWNVIEQDNLGVAAGVEQAEAEWRAFMRDGFLYGRNVGDAENN